MALLKYDFIIIVVVDIIIILFLCTL